MGDWEFGSWIRIENWNWDKGKRFRIEKKDEGLRLVIEIEVNWIEDSDWGLRIWHSRLG